MIISCPECNKRFNIDQNLIPKDGRLLQCSNCMHKWHFIIKKKEEIIEEPIKLLNMIIVIIISVAALIIIIDTFRIELSKYMPFLNPMLDSFYAIIADINSFIKDLIR